MTLEAFGAAIANLPLPAIYGPYQDAQSVPYISYTAYERNVIHADGIVIYGEDWIELRLVNRDRDRAVLPLRHNFPAALICACVFRRRSFDTLPGFFADILHDLFNSIRNDAGILLHCFSDLFREISLH